MPKKFRRYLPILFCILVLGFSYTIFSKRDFFYYVVMTDSMEPFVAKDSLVFAIKEPEYYVDDVIVYKYKNDAANLIAHRIINIESIGDSKLFETKGDANTNSDSIPVTKKEIVGKIIFAVPMIGSVVLLKKMLLIFYATTGFLVGRELKNINISLRANP